MQWRLLTSESQLNEIISLSESTPCFIYKHSKRCSLSFIVKNQIESDWQEMHAMPAYFLDLVQYRQLSNLIAGKFNVLHESPQILLIKDGRCIYHARTNS